jgi:ABC-2 type transport system ATP-binding protein
MADSMVEMDGVVKRFGEQRALDGLSLTVLRGEVLGLLGPNGAGKTTAINVLTTLLRPDEGTARVAGFDVVSDAAQVRKAIALTGQFAAVDEALTGAENLVLFGRLMGLPTGAAKAKAAELLTRFELSDAAGKMVKQYSGGMRRRLDLAASLVVEPKVLFLDEPTTGLDPRSRASLWAVVRALRTSGITVVLTTQYLEEADQLADRIVVIDDGHVVAEGTATELKSKVGASSCVVEPIDPADVPRVVEVLAPLGHPVVDDSGATVSLPADAGAATLAEAVRLLADAGIEVGDVGLRRPSLDEVFFALTGAGAS